jgi:hypothetical protein
MSRVVGAAAVLLLLTACSIVPGLGGETRPVPWTLSRVKGNELVVEAQFGGSSCTKFEEWQVEESDAEVRVRAMVRFTTDGACTDDLVVVEAVHQLAAPLGARTLTGCDPENEDAPCQ